MSSVERILDRQFRRWELERSLARTTMAISEAGPRAQPVLTVSRQRGSGGSTLAQRLATRFDCTLLHRDLIDRLAGSAGDERRLLASLDEHVKTQFSIYVDSLLAGRFVDQSDYVRRLVETIFSVSRLGGVVVVGRGANFIVGPDRGFHLRVVASRETRIRNLAEWKKLTAREAAREVEHNDRERTEFIHQLFNRSIDDPVAYDLVVNTSETPAEGWLDLVAHAALQKFERLRSAAREAHALEGAARG